MRKKVELFTDGACSGNPGPGGWAFIVFEDGKRKLHSSGYEPDTTNNRMELEAIITALEYIDKGSHITIYTDSQYVVNTCTKGWLENWIQIDFKKKKNEDLWREYHRLSKDYDITYVWVKGHSDNQYNNECDQLARGEYEKQKGTAR